MLHVVQNHPGAIYRVGSRVAGYWLAAVEPRGIELRDESGDCWLRLLGMQRPASAPKPAPHKRVARAPPARTAAFSHAELQQAIHPVGAGRYDVERALIAQAVARAALIGRTTGLQQVMRFGQPAGLLVRGLAEDGLLRHLGVMPGDMLKTFNGFSLTSLDGARLSLLVMRQGKPVALEYHLVH
jgi:hypothetical protein